MNTLWYTLGFGLMICGFVWRMCGAWKDIKTKTVSTFRHAFLLDPGMWLFCLGSFFIGLPRFGWPGGIGIAFFCFVVLAFGFTEWWALGKGVEMGTRGNQAFVRLTNRNSHKKPEPGEKRDV